MNALLAALHHFFVLCPAHWVLKALQKLISATAKTPVWQRISGSTGNLAQKSADAASRLMCGRCRLQLLQHPAQRTVEASIFPIRVIDVEETVGSRQGNVVFIRPTSWKFHTISHTWSKGVQSWSNIIARKMTEQGKGGAAESSYNDLFRREDFRWYECYAPFIDFLRLLSADGVKQVWLDALCINQESESGEKSQELQKMGSYYAKSLGCYVCAHGFGEGFETWKERERELVLPRWFNRVWTFQEMLLPKTLTFVLDIHPVIRRTINWCISQHAAQGVNGACKCVMETRPFPEPRYFLIEEGDEEDDDEQESCAQEVEVCSGDGKPDPQKGNPDKQRDIEIKCGNLPCSRCGGAALIRRAKDAQALIMLWHQSSGSPNLAPDLYFIDRQCIVRLMIMAKEQLQKTVWKICDESVEWKLLRLEAAMQQRDAEAEEESTSLAVQGRRPSNGEDNEQQQHGWDPIQVVVEVSKRDCTHDEDRILSILGLLKLEGVVQLRAGKTLEAQLLHLAQQLSRVDPTALLKLCVAQFAGHTKPGMSWAPSMGAPGGLRPTGEAAPADGAVQLSWQELSKDKQRYARQMEVEEGIESGLQQLARVMRHFVRSVQVKSVMEDGSLMLCRARVLWECRFDRVQGEDLFNLQVLITAGADHPQIIRSFPFKAYFTPSSCLLHHRVFVAAGQSDTLTLSNQSMVRLEGTLLRQRLHSFRVCLVLLGRLELPNGEKHEVMMVCVGAKNMGPLHKVGVAWLPGLEEAFSTVDLSSVCSISGFQDYMNRFVFNQPSSGVV